MYKRATRVTRAICCGWSLSFIPNTTIKRHYFGLLFCFMYANFLACAQYAKILMPTQLILTDKHRIHIIMDFMCTVLYVTALFQKEKYMVSHII